MKINNKHRRQLFARTPVTGILSKLLMTTAIFSFFMILPSLSFGQSAGWSLQKQVGDVDAYAKLDSCAGESGKTFFIKFKNTSSIDNYEIDYSISVPDAKTFPPNAGKITVNAGSSREGDCKSIPVQGLRMPCEGDLNSLSDLSIKYTITKKP